MQGVIYVDVLVLVNAILGYFMLRSTAVLAGCAKSNLRLSLAALAAGVCSLLMLWYTLPEFLALLLKFASGICIVRIAFPWNGLRAFTKSVFWYVAMNVALGGLIMLAAKYGLRHVEYRNFSVYIHMSPVLLVLCIVFMYLVVCLVSFFWGKPQPNVVVPLQLVLQDGAIKGMALVDTGLQLKDSIGGHAAVLVSLPAVTEQLSPVVRTALTEYFANGTLPTQPHLYLLPVKTATGVQALPALRGASVKIGKRQTEKPLLVFANERFADGGVCAMVGAGE